MIRFVVTGAPRASTKWTARVLTSLGLDCGHEDVCSRWGPGYSDDGLWRASDVAGECSWMAAPFADEMSQQFITVVHLVRHPLTSVRSLNGGGINLNGGQLPFHRFIAAHVGDIWKLELSEPDLCLEFWIRWNSLLVGVSDFTWVAPWSALDARALSQHVGLPIHGDEWAATALPAINGRERASVQVGDFDAPRWERACALYESLLSS